MRHSRMLWTRELRGDMIRFTVAGDIHDEWQTRVPGSYEEAEHVRDVQIKAIEQTGRDLGFLCPLAGAGDIGKNWAETH